LIAGLAEVIKHGALADRQYFEWLEQVVDDLLSADAETLTRTIKRSCELKAQIVASDEKETGTRALLNFGHTFGHAIESGLGYGEWLHGEAVGAGMVMAADLSCRLNMCPGEDALRLKSLIEKVGLPIAPPMGLINEFVTLMQRDKKSSDQGMRLVLLREIGKAEIVNAVDDGLLRETINTGERLLE
jgi:3-dehydroquinate synthase